ncbi:hypothetical protein [Pseudohalioglobus lutimaris]|uniref:hypothetical protein n=1 Tax=Pseudohalioglobus lutimaris TaxID=1737061 RepID=UPI0013FD9A26|nr:hypothetical protein [Pseudohalioglobus lutimaris]
MLWLLLVLAIAASIFVDSFRLLLLSLIALLFRAFPMATLSSLCAVIIWAIKINLRR